MNKNELFRRALGVAAAFSLLRQPGLLLTPLAALKPATAFAADPHAGHGHGPAVAPADKAQPKASGKPVYQCPMHPQIVRDSPGTCPICYMDLEKVGASGAQQSEAGSSVHGRAAFSLSPERQQRIGVRTALAEQRGLARSLRLAGRVRGDSVLAQLQELDAGALRPGLAAVLVGPGGQSVTARVSAVDGQMDVYTRSFGVRLQPAQRPAWLAGGVYVEARVSLPLGKRLAVPSAAVYETGGQRLAFVRSGDRFEPRVVVLGLRGDEGVEVLEGVKAGEEVVIGANFLIDSEARFRAVAEQYSR
jgi:hypothetical protein